jgi:hypothetical protein
VHGALGPVARAQAGAADAVALAHELAHGEAIEHRRARLCCRVVQDRVEGDAAHAQHRGQARGGHGHGQLGLQNVAVGGEADATVPDRRRTRGQDALERAQPPQRRDGAALEDVGRERVAGEGRAVGQHHAHARAREPGRQRRTRATPADHEDVGLLGHA